MKRLVYLFVMSACLVLFVGCAKPPAGSEPTAEPAGDAGHHHHHQTPDTATSRPNKDYKKIQSTNDDACKVAYKIGADVEWPPKEKHFVIIVEVMTKDGKPDESATVEVDADMPEHGHGMNSKAKVEKMPGTKNKFKASGMLFHMRGWWQIYVKVTGDCGAGTATFNTFVE